MDETITFKIADNGAKVASTDCWLTEHATKGLCYLSASAGTWRLLLPKTAEGMLPDMMTGHRAIIEPSIQNKRCVDIVFDDGTAAPFYIMIDKCQIDRALVPGQRRLAVWTLAGKVLDLACEVHV